MRLVVPFSSHSPYVWFHFHRSFAAGFWCLVTVLFPGAGGLYTGGSSCPVMSSYEKSPSCICHSPNFSVFRDVFMGRLVILVKRSHLRPCTLDNGTAVGNRNCGQRVADDHARVPKSVYWFLGCIPSTSPEPKGLSNMQFALRVFRCVAQGSFPAAFVIQGQACLEGKASHSHPPFLCHFSCLLPCHDLQVYSSAFQNTIFHLWRVSAENTLIGTVSAVVDFGRWLGSQHRSPLQNPSTSVLWGRLVSWCSGPSNPYLHVLSYHSSTIPPGRSLQVVFRHFQNFLQK